MSSEQQLNSGTLFKPWLPKSLKPGVIGVVATILLVTLLSLIALRISRNYQQPGKWNEASQGYCDFHNGVYYPAVAFGQQFSPYGHQYAEAFPVERPIPMYAPSVLLMHWPVSWFDLRVAEVIWYLLLAAMLTGIAWVSLYFSGWSRDWWLVAGVAAFMAGSRAGYGTLFTGYFTFELVLGTLLAVFAGRHTIPGGIGFAIAAIKPTTGIPLAIMMLARGHWNSLFAGSAILLVTSGLVIGWIMLDGTSISLIDQVQASQQEHREDPNELPVNTWTRVDILAIICKWYDLRPDDVQHLLVMFPLIAFPAIAVWRHRKKPAEERFPDNRADLSAAVTLLAVMITLYHHHYDLLVLSPIILAAIAGTCGWRRYPVGRWVVAILCLFPIVNYLTSNLVLNRLHLIPSAEKIVTSVNGVMLAAAFVWATFLLWSENIEPDQTGICEFESGSTLPIEDTERGPVSEASTRH